MRPGVRPLLAYLDPITAELADPAVTEVVVNRPGEVGVQRYGKWTWREVADFTADRLDQIGILAGYLTKRDLDSDHPFCGSTLPGGQRIQIARPPATLDGTIALCIRNPPKSAPSLDDDARANLFEMRAVEGSRDTAGDDRLCELFRQRDKKGLLKEAVRLRKSIGATGLTGSGKTQILRSLLAEVPADLRLLTVESDAKFGDVGPRNKAALFYNNDREGQRTPDAVKAALRMYPTTLAFQEVRGGDAPYALMRAIRTGHNSFTSWHAGLGHEIEAMCLMLRQHRACEATPDAQLIAMVKSSFDVIVSCTRVDDVFSMPLIWCRAAEERGMIWS